MSKVQISVNLKKIIEGEGLFFLIVLDDVYLQKLRRNISQITDVKILIPFSGRQIENKFYDFTKNMNKIHKKQS